MKKNFLTSPIASIQRLTGPSIIFGDDNSRYGSAKFSVRRGDMDSTIAEAQTKVDDAVKQNKGYEME